MGQQDLEKKIGAALDKHKFAAFATTENNQPKLRYMTVYRDGLKVLLATDRKTHKVEELEKNPKSALLLGFDGKWPEELVEIQGTTTVSKDESLRAKLWNEDVKRWFDGPDDPDYVILELAPDFILYTGPDDKTETWTRS